MAKRKSKAQVEALYALAATPRGRANADTLSQTSGKRVSASTLDALCKRRLAFRVSPIGGATQPHEVLYEISTNGRNSLEEEE